MTLRPDDSPLTGGRRVLRLLGLTVRKYSDIEGEQRAASFAYYAFFALFPLLLLLVSTGSYFFDSASVGEVLQNAVSQYVLVDTDKQDLVSQTIQGLIHGRSSVSFFALLGLTWSALRFFQSLVRAVNTAWGTHEYNWWRLPLRNLLMIALLVSALLVGVVVPAILNGLEALVWQHKITFGAAVIAVTFRVVRFLLPSVVLFYGFSMFYMLAPRARVSFTRVWLSSLLTTVLLQLLQGGFSLYVRNFANFNKVYGAFGGMIAVLMWVYLSGSVIILGGCFCAAQAEMVGGIDEAARED